MPGAFAEALDVAAVQLGDAARQRQADAEAAERARERLVLLREQLEGVRQEVGVDALAAVLDRDLHRLGGAPDADRRSMPGSKLNLAALTIRLRERLRQPAAVAADEQALVGDVDVEAVAAGVELVVAARDRRLDDAVDRHLLAHQRDLALGGAGDVDQLLDQVAEPADLALEDLAQADQDRVACARACAARWRRWRSAPAGLRSSCESIARNWPWRRSARRSCLGALGERLLELLALVDVDAAADEADRGAVGAEARHAVVDASSGTRRRGGAARRSSENGARASKLVARMPRQRSRSSGWTRRVQPSPRSSSTLRPV